MLDDRDEEDCRAQVRLYRYFMVVLVLQMHLLKVVIVGVVPAIIKSVMMQADFHLCPTQ